MANEEIFKSCVRPAGDYAGVFEYDGEVGYFYLYETEAEHGQKVLGSIRVLVGTPDFDDADVFIRWDATESKVGLFIRDHIWAAFDVRTGEKHGGNYRTDISAAIPLEVTAAFRA